jgi:hypothetical protein
MSAPRSGDDPVVILFRDSGQTRRRPGGLVALREGSPGALRVWGEWAGKGAYSETKVSITNEENKGGIKNVRINAVRLVHEKKPLDLEAVFKQGASRT